jgi:hypothetical protein
MPEGLDLVELQHQPRVSRCFRYPLHRKDIHEFRIGGRTQDHYTAKPLVHSIGPRNWLVAIRAAAEGDIREVLAAQPSPDDVPPGFR